MLVGAVDTAVTDTDVQSMKVSEIVGMIIIMSNDLRPNQFELARTMNPGPWIKYE